MQVYIGQICSGGEGGGGGEGLIVTLSLQLENHQFNCCPVIINLFNLTDAEVTPPRLIYN